ncbi:MAG: transposase [Deltaproteobacteria bacterium]|nr:transposase [Deltaproteobacteria bacterium]
MSRAQILEGGALLPQILERGSVALASRKPAGNRRRPLQFPPPSRDDRVTVTTPRNIAVPGAASFVTAVLHDRLPLFLYRPYCAIVLDALAFQRQSRKMRLHGFVIMPDHVHWVMTPAPPRTPSDLVRDIKTFTAKAIRGRLQHENAPDLVAALRRAVRRPERQSYKVWQDGTWIHPLLNEDELRARIVYVHTNPVRAGLCVEAEGYQWSSARSYERGDDEPIGIDRIEL